MDAKRFTGGEVLKHELNYHFESCCPPGLPQIWKWLRFGERSQSGGKCLQGMFFSIEKTTRESETERFASLFIGLLKAFWSQLDINTHSSELFRIRSCLFMFFLFGFLSMFLAMVFPEMFWPSHDSWVIWPLAVEIWKVHIIQKTSLLENKKEQAQKTKKEDLRSSPELLVWVLGFTFYGRLSLSRPCEGRVESVKI